MLQKAIGNMMSDPMEHLRHELVRLGRALEMLSHTLRAQRESFETMAAERDELRRELDEATTKITCLMMALQEARSGNDEKVVLMRGRPEKRNKLH
jgi:SMC interacting uncharacterized protein involved in chromosome segregation